MSFADAMCRANRAVVNKLGEAVIIHNQGNYVCVNGIFDNEYVETHDINGTRPILKCVTADVVNVTADISTYERDGTTYMVRVKQADNAGMTKLILEAQ